METLSTNFVPGHRRAASVVSGVSQVSEVEPLKRPEGSEIRVALFCDPGPEYKWFMNLFTHGMSKIFYY